MYKLLEQAHGGGLRGEVGVGNPTYMGVINAAPILSFRGRPRSRS